MKKNILGATHYDHQDWQTRTAANKMKLLAATFLACICCAPYTAQAATPLPSFKGGDVQCGVQKTQNQSSCSSGTPRITRRRDSGETLVFYKRQALKAAYQAGVVFQPANWPLTAHPFPLVVQAILLAESSGCMDTHGIDPHAVGCMQLHIDTAALMAGTPVSKWMLEADWVLNIRIGSSYLAYCWEVTHKAALAISCYNKGPTHAQWHDPYVTNIVRIMDSLPLDTE
jgi:Transglycosylase SLT domain